MKCFRLISSLWIVCVALLMAGCSNSRSTDLTNLAEPAPSFPAGSESGAAVNGPNALSADYLRAGDRIKVIFNDIPDLPTPTEQIIPEDGKILLPRGIEVMVLGKKRTDVEREIASLYVDAKIYRRITVNIERMASFISVEGEVRSPSTVMYRGDMNVTAAIAAAGGFTEFANRSGVVVTRAATKEQITVNVRRAVRDPRLNLPLYPGDSVYVPRSIL